MGKWKPRDLGNDWKTITLDAKGIKKAGEYQVSFAYTKGNNRLDIQNVELLENDKVISDDRHQGFSGASNEKNIYLLKLQDYKPNARYQIRYQGKPKGGIDSRGNISLTQGF